MLRRSVLLGGFATMSTTVFLRAAKASSAPESLDGPRIGAAQAPAEWLVVLCHGSGGDGPNMIGLAPLLQPYLPSAAFVSPTGPFPRVDFGYRWFPGALGNDPVGMVMRGMREGAPVFNEFIDAELESHGLSSDRLILLGFSQGSMMVLNAGLRREALPAAIISFAGLRIAKEGLQDFSGALPVLLIQGALDGDPTRLQTTTNILQSMGLEVESHLLPGLGHSIDRRGIQLAGEFIRRLA